MKTIQTIIPSAIGFMKELENHYRARVNEENRERVERIICFIQTAGENLDRLEPKEHAIDGRCPTCDRRFSEYEIKNFFYCPHCGQALINPDKHADILRFTIGCTDCTNSTNQIIDLESQLRNTIGCTDCTNSTNQIIDLGSH